MTRGPAPAWLSGTVLLLAACGSDSSTDSPTAVPTISVVSLTPKGAIPRMSPEAPLAVPCDGLIAVEVATSDWTARAPGGCGLTQLCGHVEAVVTAASGATSSAAALLHPLLQLSAPLEAWVGPASLLVRLVRDDGSPYLDASGAEISATLALTFSAPIACDAPPDGSAGAGGMPGDDPPPSAGAGGAAN